ncbi:DNA-binding anti-repressor SinI [Anaerobacillus alkaliphilus]|uniref:DNA-binding anti-repressor SinI n=1 Tax=Anaerobacillus alkaliphilus TaxID=1548597 RepID=A0A4Q0VZN4_9BACI|nr:anti-repressor SinI family protein [Anaerobacillus alkaliphilus]RXJ04051.1 DNA-binding anti-repressor SinI [Anaerobacillus alkaliphilus]
MEFRLVEGLDQEWVELIQEAMVMGISTDEILDFLLKNKS